MDAYSSAYSHDSEIVKPGYHKVELDKYKIGVETDLYSQSGYASLYVSCRRKSQRSL